MVAAITRNQTFGADFASNVLEAELALNRFTLAIQASFATHPVRHLTGDEVKRRWAIVERWYRIMRADLGWGQAKALDHVAKALKSELDGVPWTPPTRSLWRVGDR